MKVVILKTGTVEDYEAGYAVRLIEQGKAVKAPDNEAKNSSSKEA